MNYTLLLLISINLLVIVNNYDDVPSNIILAVYNFQQL